MKKVDIYNKINYYLFFMKCSVLESILLDEMCNNCLDNVCDYC